MQFFISVPEEDFDERKICESNYTTSHRFKKCKTVLKRTDNQQKIRKTCSEARRLVDWLAAFVDFASWQESRWQQKSSQPIKFYTPSLSYIEAL